MSSLLTIDTIRIALILTLLYLAYVDLRTFCLPNALTFPMIFLGLIFNFYSTAKLTNFSDAVTGSVLGYVCIWGLNDIYWRFKKQHAIGMGDAVSGCPWSMARIERDGQYSLFCLNRRNHWRSYLAKNASKIHPIGISFWTFYRHCWHY